MIKNDFTDYLIKVEELCKVGIKYTKDPYALDNYKTLEKLTKEFLEKQDIKINSDNIFKRNIYPTPNVSVRTIIFNEKKDKVLLVQERSDMGWSFPGGWSELSLSPVESAKKEVFEEAGCLCTIKRIVAVIDRYYQKQSAFVPEYIIVYEASDVKKVAEPCFEIADCKYFPIDKLPRISKKHDYEDFKLLIKTAKEGKTYFN